MPFKPGPVRPQFADLKAVLSQGDAEVARSPAYQAVRILIDRLTQDQKIDKDELKDIDDTLAQILAATFLTADDESVIFHNSRQLLAGTNVTFDDTIDNQRTINVGGGSLGTHYDAPLSDGDTSAADLIFANGECIIVQVPV